MSSVKSSKDIESGIASDEYDSWELSPERALWSSVVHLFLEDYEVVVQLATAALRAGTEAPTNIFLKYKITAMRMEAEGEYMNEICSWIDLHPDHLRRRMRSIDEKYRLNEVKWISRIEEEFATLKPRETRGRKKATYLS